MPPDPAHSRTPASPVPPTCPGAGTVLPSPQPGPGSLSANLAAFCRRLREAGASISTGEELDALAALAHCDLSAPERFRLGLRTTLAKGPADLARFDRHFAAFWRQGQHDRGDPDRAPEAPAQPRAPAPSPPGTFSGISDWLRRGTAAPQTLEAAGYSPEVSLLRRDFGTLGDDEREALARWVALLARALARRLGRARCRTRKGPLDLRATLRASLRRGGEFLELKRYSRIPRRLSLALLCDVSRSMDLYSRFLLQFLYAIQSAYRRIESFVFSTSLRPVSETLRQASWEELGERLAVQAPGWPGGTRIGESLAQFLREHGTRLLDRQTVVLIVSDGLDTGEIPLLRASMRALARRVRRVVWLNPLLGQPGYRPLCAGMQAALPFVDTFAPIHNLESLIRLARLARAI